MWFRVMWNFKYNESHDCEMAWKLWLGDWHCSNNLGSLNYDFFFLSLESLWAVEILCFHLRILFMGPVQTTEDYNQNKYF